MIGVRQIAERIGERAKLWSTPMLVLNAGDEKLFQVYVVDRLEW